MANNPEIVGCIARALELELARFILIGPVDEIQRTADESGVDIRDAAMAEESDAASACERAARMAASGQVDVLMKGLVQTADFVRAILDRELGLVRSGGLLSHVALCDVDGFDRLFLLTDAAITTYPDSTQKQTLVENAIACAFSLGIARPRVAMVAPVEKVSAKVPSTTDAAAVVSAFADYARLEIDGPFGLDVAISAEAAAVKGIRSPVAGHADVLVLPNIDAGNVLYKSLTGFARARIAGIVAGATVPVVLTSRADTEQSKLDSLRFALVVAGGAAREE
jgi:phosphate butyryltransferase